ncbi:hypothetical protein [Edaphocola flava]|uniref:hypothetical protein n=1 Tax=Edaphocola flava TaxID=2499629 RepID=UPI00100A86AA|nr:hypothetical protein [Edaphocola flava]
MKKYAYSILLLLISLTTFSQNGTQNKEAGEKNKFGIYHLRNDSVLNSYIGYYFKNVESRTTIYLSINVQIIDSNSSDIIQYVMPANIEFVDNNFELDRIPTVVKLSSQKAREIDFYKVDPNTKSKLEKLAFNKLLKKYLYRKTNIVKRDIEPKLRLALIHKWNSMGILVFQNDLSGDLELSNKEFEW